MNMYSNINIFGFKHEKLVSDIKKNVGYIVKLKKFKDCKVSSRILKFNSNDGSFNQLR